MTRLLREWMLHRSPLAPSVPLEGTETVEGLRNLERLRSASLLQQSFNSGRNNNDRNNGQTYSRRRRYQRFKGPYVEQLALEDLKKDPRPWKQFTGIQENGALAQSYTIPANLDVLCERVEENVCYYIANYIRVALVVMMLTMYLRPLAVVGAAALALSAYFSLRHAFALASETGARTQVRSEQEDSTEYIFRGALSVGTWITVAYTRCVPVLLLGFLLALWAIAIHATLRPAPSETRHRGRTPLGYTVAQCIGRQPVAGGADARLVFKQLLFVGYQWVAVRGKLAWRWSKYYFLTAWDAIRRPFAPALRSSQVF